MAGTRGTRPRGKCRYCGHTYALTKDGKVRAHADSTATRNPTTDRPPMCGGSGQLPA